MKCICEGNWHSIVTENEHLIDKKFICEHTNKVYTFFGIVWGADDFYYGMYHETGRTQLLSCVGNLDGHGYKLVV
jgi:hypothetical protein